MRPVANGVWEMAVVIYVMVELYLRPAEPFKIRADDVTAAIPRGGPGHEWKTITLHPNELRDPSKTGEFDECLALVLERQHGLADALVKVKQELYVHG